MNTVDGYFFIFDTVGEKNESKSKNKLVGY